MPIGEGAPDGRHHHEERGGQRVDGADPIFLDPQTSRQRRQYGKQHIVADTRGHQAQE